MSIPGNNSDVPVGLPHGRRPPGATGIGPAAQGTFHEIVVYTRQGCHLCEQAEQLLLAYGLEPRLIDIDQDSQLRARFNDCVPVVVIDNQERFRGRVNEVLLRRLLRR